MAASGLHWPALSGLSTSPRRVAVGIGEDGGLGALPLARALAPLDAVFVLIHVHGFVAEGEGEPVFSRDAAETSLALTLLRNAKVVLGSPCEIVVESARSLAEGLHNVAVREAIDVLVIGADHPGEAHESTAAAILRRVPCAVAIAPRVLDLQPFPIETVGVAYQPTVDGRYAAAMAGTIAGAHAAVVHAITVVPESVNPWLGPVAGAAQALARIDGTLEQIAQSDLEALGPAVDHVAHGDPIRELRTFSETVDLLVVGRHPSGPWRRIFRDSTSAALAEHSACAVLVVRHPDELETT